MGLFSKASKPNPKLIVEGIEIEFHPDYRGWKFVYRETEFSSYELAFSLPSKQELDAILDMLESLKPEMKSRLEKGLSKWSDPASTLGEGESYLVDVEEFVGKGTFIVSWSGGESWGDLGVDFTISDHAIIDEAWGD